MFDDATDSMKFYHDGALVGTVNGIIEANTPAADFYWF